MLSIQRGNNQPLQQGVIGQHLRDENVWSTNNFSSFHHIDFILSETSDFIFQR
jgi:hypothetical protein